MHVSDGNPVSFPELGWMYAARNGSKYIYSQRHIHMDTHTHTLTNIYMCICMCVYICIYIKTHMYYHTKKSWDTTDMHLWVVFGTISCKQNTKLDLVQQPCSHHRLGKCKDFRVLLSSESVKSMDRKEDSKIKKLKTHQQIVNPIILNMYCIDISNLDGS